MNENLTFNELPMAVAMLNNKVDHIMEVVESFMTSNGEDTKNKHELLNIKAASALIGKAPSTIYGMTSARQIPFHKKGNRLYFFRDELTNWIETSGQSGLDATEEDFMAHLEGLHASKKHLHKVSKSHLPMEERYSVPSFEQMPQAIAELHDKVDLVIDHLKKQEEEQAKDNPQLLNISQCSALIGKTISTIYTMCSRNTIPHHKGGNTLYFFRDELIEWIRSRKDKVNGKNKNLATTNSSFPVFNIRKEVHTQKKTDIYLLTFNRQLTQEQSMQIHDVLKQNDGYWSSHWNTWLIPTKAGAETCAVSLKDIGYMESESGFDSKEQV